jgi:hypothetical protein
LVHIFTNLGISNIVSQVQEVLYSSVPVQCPSIQTQRTKSSISGHIWKAGISNASEADARAYRSLGQPKLFDLVSKTKQNKTKQKTKKKPNKPTTTTKKPKSKQVDMVPTASRMSAGSLRVVYPEKP